MNSIVLTVVLEFPILSLAVFGIAYVLRYMDCPLWLCRRVRELAGVRYIPVYDGDALSGYIEEIPQDKLGAKFFGCHWCISTWVSFIVFGAYVYWMRLEILWFVVLSFAGMAVSGIIHDRIL